MKLLAGKDSNLQSADPGSAALPFGHPPVSLEAPDQMSSEASARQNASVFSVSQSIRSRVFSPSVRRGPGGTLGNSDTAGGGQAPRAERSDVPVCRWCGEGPVKALGLCLRHYVQWYDERNRDKRRAQWRASKRAHRAPGPTVGVCEALLCGRTFVQSRNGQRRFCSVCQAAFFWPRYAMRQPRAA